MSERPGRYLTRRTANHHFRRRVVRLDLGALPALGQFAWLVYCACLVDLSGQRHTIALSVEGLGSECRDFASSCLLKEFFPSVKVTTSAISYAPDPAEEFVYIAGSEVFNRKLLVRFKTLFVRPSAFPRNVDTAVYWENEKSGKYFEVLSRAVHAFNVPGADAGLRSLKHRFAASSRMVALMTSIYDGDRYLDGFLDNAARLRHYDRHEHFLVRAASPGHEHDALLQYVQNQPNAVYVNLEADPGLYGVWNLIACVASGRYLSSANLDDRRSPTHIAMLCRVLEQSGTDVASTALRVTTVPNLTWEESDDSAVWYTGAGGTYQWTKLIYDADGTLRSRNLPHCMPVWHRRMHGDHGLFRERSFGPSADWEFWLRAGTQGASFYLFPEPLGLYLKTPQSYWNTAAGDENFDAKILNLYRQDQIQNRQRLVAPEVAELADFAACGAYFGLFHRLLSLSLRSDFDSHFRAAVDDVIDRFGLMHFGIRSISSEVRTAAAADRELDKKPVDVVGWTLHFLAENAAGFENKRGIWLSLLADMFDATDDEQTRMRLAEAGRSLATFHSSYV